MKMKGRNLGLAIFAVLFLAALGWTGWEVLDYSEIQPAKELSKKLAETPPNQLSEKLPETPPEKLAEKPPEKLPEKLSGLPKVIFGFHLALWMIVGMAANYLWDLFRSGKSWQDVTWRGLLMPVLISPIVFFSVWSIWKGDPITFALPLIAFQNGFFWQVVFSKAGAVDKPR